MLRQKGAHKILPRLTPSLSSRRNSLEEFPRIVVYIIWDNIGEYVFFPTDKSELRMNFPNSKLIVYAQRENMEFNEACPYVDQWIWIRGHHNLKFGMTCGTQRTYWIKKFCLYCKLAETSSGAKNE